LWIGRGSSTTEPWSCASDRACSDSEVTSHAPLLPGAGSQRAIPSLRDALRRGTAPQPLHLRNIPLLLSASCLHHRIKSPDQEFGFGYALRRYASSIGSHCILVRMPRYSRVPSRLFARVVHLSPSAFLKRRVKAHATTSAA